MFSLISFLRAGLESILLNEPHPFHHITQKKDCESEVCPLLLIEGLLFELFFLPDSQFAGAPFLFISLVAHRCASCGCCFTATPEEKPLFCTGIFPLREL